MKEKNIHSEIVIDYIQYSGIVFGTVVKKIKLLKQSCYPGKNSYWVQETNYCVEIFTIAKKNH